jgi:hypothetical protein
LFYYLSLFKNQKNKILRKVIPVGNRQYLSLLVIILIIAGCNGVRSKKGAGLTAIPRFDSTCLFDGNTLAGWEVTNFGPQGPVYVSNGVIILGMGDGCTGITYKKEFPVIDYRVSLDAKRVSGNDFFCGLTFPVDGSPCTLIVGGWAGPVVGLSCINGSDASENETTRLMSFEQNRWYHISLKVTSDSINAWIDSSRVVTFAIDDKKLSIRPEVELSRPFGIASWKTTAALKNIRLEKL